jgi:hypothetical protein
MNEGCNRRFTSVKFHTIISAPFLDSNTLHYITFSVSKVSQNDCRMRSMSYIYKNMCIEQLKFSHKKTQENTVVTRKAIQKYIHMLYILIPATYAIYTTFRRMSYF